MAKRVRIDVDVDSRKGVQSISKVGNSVKNLENQSSKSAKKISDDFARIKKGLIGIGAAIVAAKIAQGFSQMTKEILKYGDQLQKLNLRLGIGVSELDKLKQVAELSGVAFSTLTMGLQRMQRRVSEAAAGTGEAKGALEELGISAKELVDLPLSEQFQIIAEKLDGVKNSGDKTRLTMKLMDSSGVQLIQMFENLRSKVDKTSSTINKEGADAISQFNDNMTTMKQNIKNNIQPIIIDLAKTFNVLYSAMSGQDQKESPENLIEKVTSKMQRRQAELKRLENQSWGRNKKREEQLKTEIEVYKEQIQFIKMAQRYEVSHNTILGKKETVLKKVDDATGNLKKKTEALIGLTIGADGMPILENAYDIDYGPLNNLNNELDKTANKTKQVKTALIGLTLDSFGMPINDESYDIDYGASVNYEDDEEYKRKLASDAERTKTTFQKWQESAQTTSDLITEVVLKASDAIASGMTNALYDFIDGTKSAQDAFKDFARDFLSQITKMIIQQQILNALKTSSGFFGAMFADGGVAPGGFKAFASGGTVTKPTLGLVGEGSMNEAIVPLPDGKSIPVDLKNNNNKAPNVKIEVINNGNNVEATQTTPKFDGQQWVIGVVLDAINNNVGFKNQIKGAVTS